MPTNLKVITAKVPPAVVDAAADASGLPDPSPSVVVRFALYRLAGYAPAEARRMATAPKHGDRSRMRPAKVPQ